MFAQTKVMTETDSKKLKQAEFTQKHTISPADFKKMIAEKMERARAYSKAVKKREALLAESR